MKYGESIQRHIGLADTTPDVPVYAPGGMDAGQPIRQIDHRPVYTADLWRSPIGWRFTVRRDEHIIGSSPRWLSPLFRSRAEALNAATKCALNDKARRSVRLPV